MRQRWWAVFAVSLVAVPSLAACGDSTHRSVRGVTLAESSTTSTTSTTPGVTRPRVRSRSECIDAIPRTIAAGQLVMASVQGESMRSTGATFARAGFGGAFVLGNTRGLTRSTVEQFKHAGKVPLLLAVDEEGGLVQRLADVVGALPSAFDIARSMSPGAAQRRIARHAAMVRALGFDVAFAPVVDVLPSNGRPGPIGADHRAFSTDPEVVAQYGAAYVDAWTSVGMIAVLKHFPGHGGATTDTHRSLAVVPPLATLEHRDLIPFRTILQHAPRGRVAVMVGHLVVPGLTDGAPASVSPAALALLRDTLGFGGPVFSDALDMGAIVHRELPSEAAVRSIGAGVDIVLIAGFRSASAAVQAIASAVPQRISGQRFDEAVDHVLALKGRDPCSLAATD